MFVKVAEYIADNSMGMVKESFGNPFGEFEMVLDSDAVSYTCQKRRLDLSCIPPPHRTCRSLF
jgi:hypothetical protein